MGAAQGEGDIQITLAELYIAESEAVLEQLQFVSTFLPSERGCTAINITVKCIGALCGAGHMVWAEVRLLPYVALVEKIKKAEGSTCKGILPRWKKLHILYLKNCPAKD